MNHSLLFFLEITDGPTRLFQNCFVIFLSITGFYLCSKYASTKIPSKKMTGPDNETKRTNFIRLILYLICFFGIAGICLQQGASGRRLHHRNIFIAGRDICLHVNLIGAVWKNGDLFRFPTEP